VWWRRPKEVPTSSRGYTGLDEHILNPRARFLSSVIFSLPTNASHLYTPSLDLGKSSSLASIWPFLFDLQSSFSVEPEAGTVNVAITCTKRAHRWLNVPSMIFIYAFCIISIKLNGDVPHRIMNWFTPMQQHGSDRCIQDRLWFAIDGENIREDYSNDTCQTGEFAGPSYLAHCRSTEIVVHYIWLIFNEDVCALIFESCNCSYDGYWRLTWSLISRSVGLVEVRANWPGHPR